MLIWDFGFRGKANLASGKSRSLAALLPMAERRHTKNLENAVDGLPRMMTTPLIWKNTLVQKMKKRKSRRDIVITAHKGGRTKRAPSALLTPADDKKLRRHLRESELSFGDWLKAMIAIDCRSWRYTYELPSGEMQAEALADSLGEAVENAIFHAQGRKILISNQGK